MSFISVVAGEDFLSIMSDGRVVSGDTFVEERHQKFKMINDEMFIAFTGHKDPIDALLEALNEEVITDGNFMQTAKEIKDVLSEHEAFLNCKMTVIIGGINGKQQVEFVVLSTSQECITQSIPEKSETKIMTGYAFNSAKTNLNYEDINQKFLDFLSAEGNFKSAQISLHEYMADIDYSCNKEIFHEVILKK